MSFGQSTPKRGGRSRYTQRWIMADGTKIRLEDMTDSHLANTIKWMERKAEEAYPDAVTSAYAAYGWLQGEMASMEMESITDALEENGWEYLLPSIYYDMHEELERRKVKT